MSAAAVGYEYPDVPAALLEIVPNSTLWLSSLDETVNHIYSVGGHESGASRFDRIVINTYAEGRTAAHVEAEVVRQIMTAGHHSTTKGLLDSVAVEVTPHDILFASETVTQVQAIYRVYTRPV